MLAQVLEGPQASNEALMRSIAADGRHRDVTVVETIPLRERRFPDWSMAYSGPSLYVDRHLKPLLAELRDPGADSALVAKLIGLLQELPSRPASAA